MATKIIKAVCTTDSADDKMARVKLKSEGIWNQDTELVQSVNGCALNKGDVVFVAVVDGYYNPLILGKADRNEIVLNLLVNRINALEDKLNDTIKQQNQILAVLEASSAVLAGTEPIGTWSGSAALTAAVQSLAMLPKKTKLKDIEDNYK